MPHSAHHLPALVTVLVLFLSGTAHRCIADTQVHAISGDENYLSNALQDESKDSTERKNDDELLANWLLQQEGNEGEDVGDETAGDADKRRNPFLGKRRNPFLGKRRSPFLGKRASPFLGKRRSPFLGKRRSPFLGKRSISEDINESQHQGSDRSMRYR